MGYSILAIRTADGEDGRLYPVVGDDQSLVELEPLDGSIQRLSGRAEARMRTSRKVSALAVPLAMLSLMGTGCAGSVLGSGLSASSSCKDFMTASQGEQAEAISKLSSQLSAPVRN
jgi:hypothetical protein